MATQSDIKEVIYNTIDSIVNPLDIIWYNQPEKGSGKAKSAPQPTGTYVELSFLTGPLREGLIDEVRFPLQSSDFEKAIITGQRLLTISVEVFGSGSYDYAVDIQNGLQIDDILDELKRRQQTTINIDTAIDFSSYAVSIDGLLIEYTSFLFL